MSSPPLPDPDALSADELKRLVARLLARVVALEEENRQLDFARSGGPAGDEQKALEEAGGDFRALRVGP